MREIGGGGRERATGGGGGGREKEEKMIQAASVEVVCDFGALNILTFLDQ